MAIFSSKTILRRREASSNYGINILHFSVSGVIWICGVIEGEQNCFLFHSHLVREVTVKINWKIKVNWFGYNLFLH